MKWEEIKINKGILSERMKVLELNISGAKP